MFYFRKSTTKTVKQFSGFLILQKYALYCEYWVKQCLITLFLHYFYKWFKIVVLIKMRACWPLNCISVLTQEWKQN